MEKVGAQPAPVKKSPSKWLKRAAIAMVLIVALGGLYFFVRHRHKPSAAKKDSNTVVIDGVTYTLDLPTDKQTVNNSAKSVGDYKLQIQDLKNRIKQFPSYANYVALGELYEKINDKQQAIDSYKKAKQYIPKDQNYQKSLDELNKRIQSLEVKL